MNTGRPRHERNPIMTEDWKTWNEPPKTSVVLWRHKNGLARMSAHDGTGWYHSKGGRWRTWPQVLAHIAEYGYGTPPRIVPLDEPEPEPEPERVVVWKTGDPIDKLKPYMGKEGVEVRAERDGTVVVGPLKRVYADAVALGSLTLTASRWNITVTAPPPVAPWWLVDQIKKGHVVSWAHAATGDRHAFAWCGELGLAYWRANWDESADPATWRVTDVHAAGGPKLIAGGQA